MKNTVIKAAVHTAWMVVAAVVIVTNANGLLSGYQFLGGIALVTVTCFGPSIASRYSKSTWFCTVMDWHQRPAVEWHHGDKPSGMCPRCKATVHLELNGEWH